AWFPAMEENSPILVFIKYFNPNFKYFNPDTQSLEGVCYLYVRKFDKIGDIIPILCEKKNFPSHTHLRIYEEIKPGMIENMKPEFTFQQSEIENGDIICFQKALTNQEVQVYTTAGHICDIPTFYKLLAMRIVVQFKPKYKYRKQEPEFELILNEKYTYEEIEIHRNVILTLIHVAIFLNMDPLKLRFTTAHPTSGAYKATIKSTTTQTLLEMLQATNLSSSKNFLYYETLDISIIELETEVYFKVHWLGTTIKEKTVTINELLKVIVQKLAIPKPTHRIRLYDVLHCKIQNEYNFNDPVDKIQENLTLYAEEIPQDEIELRANDKIIQAFHFTKEPLRTHGIPFKFVLKACELFSTTKLRLRLRLGMSEIEFSKVKFAIIPAVPYAKPQYIEDNNVILSDYGLTDELLGLDHHMAIYIRR
ncbi:19034_t:CDS:10, partial [Racocetra persica]